MIAFAPMEIASVSQVVWRWRQTKTPGPGHNASTRRKHAVIEFSVVLCVSLLVRYVFDHVVMSYVILCIGSVVLIGGLFVPPVYYGFKRFGAILGRVLAQAVTWILLVPFFYIFCTIARLGCLLTGKDLMKRRFERDAATYWVEHAGTPAREQYRKQY